MNIMGRIHASTWVLVGHPTSVSHELDRTVTHYRTTRVRVDRPASDEVFAEAACGHCGAVLEVRVLSARRTVRLRLLWALLALAGLVACAYLTYVGIREMGVDATDPADTASTRVEAGSLLGSAIGFVAFAIGLVFALTATGIRIINDPLGSGRQTLLKRSWSGPDRVTGRRAEQYRENDEAAHPLPPLKGRTSFRVDGRPTSALSRPPTVMLIVIGTSWPVFCETFAWKRSEQGIRDSGLSLKGSNGQPPSGYMTAAGACAGAWKSYAPCSHIR